MTRLQNLPVDVTEKILLDLTIKEIFKSCRTDKKINRICERESFWRKKVTQTYGIKRLVGKSWSSLAKLLENNVGYLQMIDMNLTYLDGKTYMEILNEALDSKTDEDSLKYMEDTIYDGAMKVSSGEVQLLNYSDYDDTTDLKLLHKRDKWTIVALLFTMDFDFWYPLEDTIGHDFYTNHPEIDFDRHMWDLGPIEEQAFTREIMIIWATVVSMTGKTKSVLGVRTTLGSNKRENVVIQDPIIPILDPIYLVLRYSLTFNEIPIDMFRSWLEINYSKYTEYIESEE